MRAGENRLQAGRSFTPEPISNAGSRNACRTRAYTRSTLAVAQHSKPSRGRTPFRLPPMQLTHALTSTFPTADGLLQSETVPTPGSELSGVPVGTVEPCGPTATNEHVTVRVPSVSRAHAVRGRFVKTVA